MNIFVRNVKTASIVVLLGIAALAASCDAMASIGLDKGSSAPYTIINGAPGGSSGNNHGSVTVAVNSKGAQTGASVQAAWNDVITLGIYPEAGYALSGITVLDTAGGGPTVGGAGNSRYFIMPASDLTITAFFAQSVTPPVPPPGPAIPKRVSWYLSDGPGSDTPSATAEWSGDTVTAALINIKNNPRKFSTGVKAVIVINGAVTAASEGVSGATLFTIAGVYPPLVFRGDATNKGVIDGGGKARVFMIKSRTTGVPNEVTLADNLTLQNGRAVSETPADTVGGAVCVQGGAFNMSGGAILNSAATSGGAVAAQNWGMDGVPRNLVSLSGGEISGCVNDKRVASLSCEGAAVYIIDGSLTLFGTVSIHDNGANGLTEKGGAVYLTRSAVATELTMSGGSITANAAREGAGVYVGPLCVFTLLDGAVTGNTAARAGGGVFVYKSAFVPGAAATFTQSGGNLSANIPNDVER
jgi:hypothetical protein